MVQLRLILFCLIFGSVIGTMSAAAPRPLEGADDPRLQRAVVDWLEGKNLFPILRMAILARQGNTAARFLLGDIEHSSEPWSQHLPRSLRWALFRDTSRRRFGERWRSVEARRGHPLAIALSHEIETNDPEAWKARVRTLLAWGERQHVLRETGIMLQQHPPLAEFAESYVNVGDIQQFAVWSTRWIAAWRIENLPASEERMSGATAWSRYPWTESEEAAFRAELNRGRLSAIMFQWERNSLARSWHVPVTYGDDRYDPLDRMLVSWDLMRLLKEHKLSLDQYRAAGALLVDDARRGGTLRPLHNLCRLNCRDEVALCMHAGGTLSNGGLSQGLMENSPRESVISQDRWLASPRASGALLHQMRGIMNYSYPKMRSEGHNFPDLGQSACFRRMMEPGAVVELR